MQNSVAFLVWQQPVTTHLHIALVFVQSKNDFSFYENFQININTKFPLKVCHSRSTGKYKICELNLIRSLVYAKQLQSWSNFLLFRHMMREHSQFNCNFCICCELLTFRWYIMLCWISYINEKVCAHDTHECLKQLFFFLKIQQKTLLIWIDWTWFDACALWLAITKNFF